MTKPPTASQRNILMALKQWIAEGPIPSGHLRYRSGLHPGPALKRMEARGWVESNGVIMPEGKCYRITCAGLDALKGDQHG